MDCCHPTSGLRAGHPSRQSAADQGFTSAQAGTAAAGPALPDGLVRIPGGTFLMGTNDPDGWPDDGEGPVRDVHIRAFLLGEAAVTNAEFGEFVAATGYRTEAEQFGWSYVFHLLVPDKVKRRLAGSRAVQNLRWWIAVEGAKWDKPEGPGSHVRKRLDHPVVHVTWNDAAAYCRWRGGRLPTEAEWEFAARGGLVQKRYCWGDELVPDGKHRCNIWQGRFPHHNSAEDGFVGTAPARSFPPNGFGLRNMAGNVWEWCADWFSPTWHVAARPETRIDPKGPPTGSTRVMRGGSYLCHDSYCNRYRVGARTANTPDSSTGNCGFRFAMDLPAD